MVGYASSGWGWSGEHGRRHYNHELVKRAMEVARSLPRRTKPADAIRVGAGLEEDAGLYSRVSWDIAHAPYLALVDTAGGRVVDASVAPNPLAGMRGGVGVAIARWLIDNSVDVVVAGRLGQHALEALAAKRIKIVQPLPGETLEALLRRLGLIA